jgi:tripartite-type tricarboxylate transporter receptor subunit TctC
MLKRRAVLAASAVPLVGKAAYAQGTTFPNKSIRLYVPAPPGGAIDTVARLSAEKLQTWWGQTVVVENKPGATQTLATDLVAKAPPDGYNLVIVASSHAVNPLFFKTLPYDTLKDLAPVIQTHNVPLMLAVTPSLPAKTVPELIALLKAKPGEYSYASSGPGSSLHMAAELFLSMTGTKMLHVPYRGSTAAHPDLMSGRTQVIFDTVTAIAGHAKTGGVRALAVTTAKRSNVAPDVPTMIEAGLPGYDMGSWGGFVAPMATPKDVIDKLNAGFARALAEPDVVAKLDTAGIQVAAGTPQQFDAFIRQEMARWAKVAQDAGIKPE